MNQASSSSSDAELNDLSSSRGLTYSVRPGIAYEILYRRLPLLADIMAISVGIMNSLKKLLPYTTLDLSRNPYPDVRPIQNSDADGKPIQYSDTEIGPIQHPCTSCQARGVILAFQLCRFLVLMFTPGPRDREDRRPYISRIRQIDAQRVREALAELYDQISGGKGESGPCAIGWCHDDHPLNPDTGRLENNNYVYSLASKSQVLDESIIRINCPWAFDYLPNGLRDAEFPLDPRGEHQDFPVPFRVSSHRLLHLCTTDSADRNITYRS